MLRIVCRWLTWGAALTIVAGCAQAGPAATLAPVAGPTMQASTATRAPTHTPPPSPMPTALPTATPTPVEAPACGHPYFPLLPQTYWRYTVTTWRGDGEPAPQAPAELRVASIEGGPGHTVATLTYAPVLTYGGAGTYSLDCAVPAASARGPCSSSSDPFFADFYRYLPPAEQLVPGYSWNGCSSSIRGSSGGYRFSTGYTVVAAEPVVFQGRQYEGLEIRQVEIQGITPGGGVTIYNRATAEATKVYTIELARGIGIVRRVAVGEVPCSAEAPTPREQVEACESISLTVDYELLEYGNR